MILRTMFGGNAEIRMAEYGSSAIPAPGSGYSVFTGRNVSTDTAFGMPAVSSAIRLISETIAGLPILVYDDNDNERANDSSQYELLHDRPNAEQDPFQWKSDICVSLEASGNAFIQKIKARGKVVELHVIDPDVVRVRRDRDTNEKRFDIIVDGKSIKDLTQSDILHIRGWAPPGSLVGFSPISMHRQVLANALAITEWVGRFWSNDAAPGMVIKVPGQLSSAQAKGILDTWSSNHGGLQNAHRPAVLAGGAEIQTLPFSFNDAAYIEQSKMGIADVARIWRVPESMIGGEGSFGKDATEQESIRFLRYSLAPRLRRIEQALAHDADLFGGTGLYPEFLADALLRPDTATRFTAYVQARQAGWLSANEIRALENYPSIGPEGDSVQVTPVGGAPNMQPGGASV